MWDDAYDILNEWYEMCEAAVTPKEVNNNFMTTVKKLNHHGILNSGATMEEFVKFSINSVIQHCLSLMDRKDGSYRQESVWKMDCLAKFFSLIIVFSNPHDDVQRTKHLRETLKFVCNITISDCKELGATFNGYPHKRLLLSLLNHQVAPCKDQPESLFSLVDSFTRSLSLLQPACIPNFAMSWLDIVSNPLVIKTCLVDTAHLEKSRSNYAQLLAQCLKYLAAFVGNDNEDTKISADIFPFYESVLRFFMHLQEIPEVLYQNANLLTSFVPFRFVQLRNIILCAYPATMVLRDPFVSTEVPIDQIPEMRHDATINTELQIGVPAELDDKVRMFIKTQDEVYLAGFASSLLDEERHWSKYSAPILCSFVLRLGILDIANLQRSRATICEGAVSSSSITKIFAFMCKELCNEGRYALFTSMANQLRYPNVHTHYFIVSLLVLYQKVDVVAREILVRVLLERVLTFRPHPWGLMIILMELVKNQKYQLWEHDFSHACPEIEQAIERIAQSCDTQHDSVGESESDRGTVFSDFTSEAGA